MALNTALELLHVLTTLILTAQMVSRTSLSLQACFQSWADFTFLTTVWLDSYWSCYCSGRPCGAWWGGHCSMAASFYASPLIGATTTLACFAHEIPHEIADYSILIRSGFTKKQAMQSQFLTAIGAFVSSFFSVVYSVKMDLLRTQFFSLPFKFPPTTPCVHGRCVLRF